MGSELANLLLVEDEEMIRECIKEHLYEAGYNILEADNFENAKDILDNKNTIITRPKNSACPFFSF